MGFKRVLWVLYPLLLLGCSADSQDIQQAREFIQKIPLEIFQNVHWKKAPNGDQFLYQVCVENRVLKVVDFSQEMKPSTEESLFLGTLRSRIQEWQMKLTGVPLKEVKGTHQCGKTLLFLMKSGDYIVKSELNMDNTIGFNHSRRVIQDGWSYYKKK
jgi:hypothetical protein